VGVIDESGFVKQGTHSVGVQRQYCGHVGKKENCQMGVFLVGVTPAGSALLEQQLYLPETWASDADRRDETGVPEDITFQTKPQIAIELLRRTAWSKSARALAMPAVCAFLSAWRALLSSVFPWMAMMRAISRLASAARGCCGLFLRNSSNSARAWFCSASRLAGSAYGQFIQPNCNFAVEQGLQSADQGTFGGLTGRRRHRILRISPCLLG
jgi:hypothetical protein